MACSNHTLIAVLCGVLGALVACGAGSDVRAVAQDEVPALAGDPATLLLDVRTPEEYAQGHVPGALNIPYDELGERLDELGTPREVVVYCESGRRAGIGAEVLLEAGYAVGHLEGDMSGWRRAGLPIESAASP